MSLSVFGSSNRMLQVLSGALAAWLLLAAPAAQALVTVSEIRLFWVHDRLDGSPITNPWAIEGNIDGTGITTAKVVTAGGTFNYGVSGSEVELFEQYAAQATLETNFPNAGGNYDFILNEGLGDEITFTVSVTRPTEPTGFPAITSPTHASTTGTTPTFSWTCGSCSGEQINAVVVDVGTDTDVFEISLAVGSSSWTPGALAAGDYQLETWISNSSHDPSVSVDPGAPGGGDSFTISLGLSYEHINSVEFTVPEAGSALLFGPGLLALLALRRRL